MSVDLKAGIVRVIGPDGATAGTGFIVTGDSLIATCAPLACGRGGHSRAYSFLIHNSQGSGHAPNQRTSKLVPARWFTNTSSAVTNGNDSRRDSATYAAS